MKCKELVNFAEYVSNDQIDKSPKTIIQKANDLKMGNLFSLEPEYDYLEIYMEAKMICIQYTLSEDNFVLFHIFNRYSISIYVFLDEIDLSVDKHLFKYECNQFIACAGYILNRYQIHVTYLEEPYQTNCLDYYKFEFNFKTPEKIYNSGDCFNECVKSKYRLGSLFYSSADNLTYKWDENNGIRDSVIKDKKFLENCNSICSKQNFDLGFALDYVQNRILIDIEEFQIEVTGKPYLNQFQYYLQLFGLISCLFNLTLLKIIDSIIDYSKLFISIDFKLIYKLKNIFFLIMILIIILNFNLLFEKYYDDLVEIDRKELTNHYTHYKVYFCFFISKMLNGSKYYNYTNYTLEEKKYGKEIFYNNTIDFLLNNTRNFTDVLKSVESNLRTTVNFKPGQRLFNKVSICFELFLDINQGEFIVFNFRIDSNKAYLLKDKMDLNLRSRRYFGDQKNDLENKFKIGKLSNCINYAEFTSGKCSSKQSCVDKCVIEKYAEKHPQKFPLLLIFEDDLKKHNEYRNYSFLPIREKNITIECRAKYFKLDCNFTVYNRDTKVTSFDIPNQKIFNLSLFDKEINYYEETKNGINYLLFDFLTIYSILLGINLPKLIFVIAKIFNFNYGKKSRYLFYLFILSVFTFHLFHILKDAFEIIEFLYFFDYFSQYDKTYINICVEHKLNLNRSITCNQLEKESKNINLELLIDRIEYIDPNYQLKYWHPDKGVEKLGKNLKLETTYFLNYKCLTFTYSIDTSSNLLNFHFYILKFYLNNHTYSEIIYFANSRYSFFQYPVFEKLFTLKSYQMSLDKYITITVDYLKEDREPIDKDDLLDKFQRKYHKTTLKLPLNKKYFNLEINDTLFDKFMLNNRWNSSGVEEKIYSKLNPISKEFTIGISKNMFRRFKVIQNRKSLSSLSIDIFNAISFYFTLSCFDLIHLILNFLKNQFIKLIQNLKTKLLILGKKIYRKTPNINRY